MRLLNSQSLTELNFKLYRPRSDLWFFYLNEAKKVIAEANQKLTSKKIELREYQLSAIASYCERDKNLSALSQGLGKTLIAALVLYLKVNLDKPASAIIILDNEIAKMRWLQDLGLIFEPSLYGFVSRKQLNQPCLLPPIILLTIDSIKKCPQIVKTINPQAYYAIDEIHHYKYGSLKFEALALLLKDTQNLLGLSGTLCEASPYQLSKLLSLFYGSEWVWFGKDKAFEKAYSKPNRVTRNYLDNSKVKERRIIRSISPGMFKEYANLITNYIHRVSIDNPEIYEQLTLPQTEYINYQCELSASARDLYDRELDLKINVVSTLDPQELVNKRDIRAENLLYRAIQICNTDAAKEGVTAKAQLALDFVRSNQKTVIFCHHVASADYIQQVMLWHYRQQKVIRVDAQMKQAERIKTVLEFESRPEIKVGIFSSNLCAEAIDLVAADGILIYCCPWSATTLDQMLRRTLRPGNQHPKVRVATIQTKDTIDSYQQYLMELKLTTSRSYLDYREQLPNYFR